MEHILPRDDQQMVVVDGTEVTFTRGEKFDYRGDKIGIRVALFNGRETTVMDSFDFITYARRSARNFFETIEEYVGACPGEPYLPLRYSPLQESLEGNQIVVFRHYPDRNMRRVRLSDYSTRITGDMGIDIDTMSELHHLFEEPSVSDLIYLQIRPLLDHTHVPNIESGIFNGKFDGKSVLGDSDNPKIGKRMQLIQTPRVKSTLDLQSISVAKFEPGTASGNPLDSPYLLHLNMIEDRSRWGAFLRDHKVEATASESDDLYLSINAGCLIGNPLHNLETVDKTGAYTSDEMDKHFTESSEDFSEWNPEVYSKRRYRAMFWRQAHTGDKLVGVGPLEVDGNKVCGIIKGTRLDWAVKGVDFLVSDAFKGVAPTEVPSQIVYTAPTELVSNGFRYASLPMTTGLYSDRLGDLEEINHALNGDRRDDLLESMMYTKKTEDGIESRLPKSGDVMLLSNVGFWTNGVWFSRGLDDMFLGYAKKRVVKQDLLIWKVLSPTIGKELEEVFVPAQAFHQSRIQIAHLLQRQDDQNRNLVAMFQHMTEWELMDWVNDHDFQSLLVTVPMIPGVHTKHKLRVWENDTVGLHPRLMLSLLRDADGDQACVVIPRV